MRTNRSDQTEWTQSDRCAVGRDDTVGPLGREPRWDGRRSPYFRRPEPETQPPVFLERRSVPPCMGPEAPRMQVARKRLGNARGVRVHILQPFLPREATARPPRCPPARIPEVSRPGARSLQHRSETDRSATWSRPVFHPRSTQSNLPCWALVPGKSPCPAAHSAVDPPN